MFTFLAPLLNRNQLADVRRRDFYRLDEQSHTYLDYTGGNLAPASLVRGHAETLTQGIFGNPHSVNPSSSLATEACETARRRVLRFFNGSNDYYCIFTSGATAAIKIVGECFPWAVGSRYLMSSDNHNSVHGIREYATAAGATFNYVGLDADLRLNYDRLRSELATPGTAPSLLALPGQSNASGVKHDLEVLTEARRRGWYTLLDAAAFVPTNRMDLSVHQPDFVCASFYKMFGYPTGLGCLLVRKDSFPLLRKRWFAGGTVTISSVAEPGFSLHGGHERYENGTIDYQGIPAITKGLDYLDDIGMDRINRHVTATTEQLNARLRGLHYANGQAKVAVYGPADRTDCGGTLIFNLLDSGGGRIPFATVEAAAAERNISLRAGCFCNPGVDEAVNEISARELREFYTDNPRPHYADMLALRAEGRGCVRVSVGFPTNELDIDRLISFLRDF